MITRILTNAGQPLTFPNGTPAANIKIAFKLVRNTGDADDVFDAATGERIAPGPIYANTDASGVFSVSLWPTSRGDAQTFYLCIVPLPGVKDIIAPLPDEAGAYSWQDFKLGATGPPAPPWLPTPLEMYDVSSWPSLADAIGSVSTYGKTLWISTPVSCDSLDFSGRNVRVLAGGLITVNPGQTLNAVGISAGRYQIFAGAGSVTGIEEALPEWFGALADGLDASATANTTAINKALTSSEGLFMMGHYKFNGTLDFGNKKVRGGKRPRSISTCRPGETLLEFIGTDVGVPAVNFYGFYDISHMAIIRTGAGTRGVILNLSSQSERTSRVHNLLLTGASYCIYGGNSANYLYSCIFQNIEFGNYNQIGFFLRCAGATGSVFINLYSSNWLAYPTTKNTAQAFIWFEGSFCESFFSQINCEHSGITNACFLINGMETSVWNSIHVEGVEFSANAQIFNIIAGGNRAKTTINSLSMVFSKFLGDGVRAFNIANNANDDFTLFVKGFNTRNNDLNGTTNHRFAIRSATIGTNTPKIIVQGASGDVLMGNSYLPIEATTYKPVIEQFNSEIFYSIMGGVIYLPKVTAASWPPASGIYPRNAIVMNSTVDGTSARGWHIWAKGNFAKPQNGNISVTQFISAATPDATAYAAYSIGDWIEINGTNFLITNKYSGNVFELGSNPTFATGSYACKTAAPQYRSF